MQVFQQHIPLYSWFCLKKNKNKTDEKCHYYLLWKINAIIPFKNTSNTMLKIILFLA